MREREIEFRISSAEGGAAFPVRVVPRASKNEISGRQGEAVKIRLAAPPVEGAANEALIDFLAKILEVPLSSEGFFEEAQLKLRPMDFMREGIFLAGMAHYPKFIEESISHALAAAAESAWRARRFRDGSAIVPGPY